MKKGIAAILILFVSGLLFAGGAQEKQGTPESDSAPGEKKRLSFGITGKR